MKPIVVSTNCIPCWRNNCQEEGILGFLLEFFIISTERIFLKVTENATFTKNADYDKSVEKIRSLEP